MKKQTSLSVAIALILSSITPLTLAHAGSGTGVRGGGTVVDVNSTPHLMDLVSKAVCVMKSGTDLVLENPELEDVLSKVEALDWYFGLELRRELEFLTYCFTGPLYRLPDTGPGRGVIPEPVESSARQAAYRLNEKAYVDTAIYDAMNAHHRAYLVLHELLHSYLPMDLLDRKIMLRSLVKALERVQKGEIKSRKALHFQLRATGVDFPLETDALDRYRKAVTFLTSTREAQIQMIRAEANPESLFLLPAEMISKLASWDQARLHAEPAEKIFSSAMIQALVESDPDEFTSLIDRRYRNFDILKLALSILPQLETTSQDALFASNAFRTLHSRGFASIQKATVSAGEYRIQANAALVRLTEETEELDRAGAQPLTDLHGPTRLPTELGWLVNSVAYLIKNDRMDQVVAHVTENESFYSALGLKNARAALDAIQAPISREKPLAIAVLKGIQEALIQRFMEAVRAQLTAAQYEEFESKVRKDRF